MKRKKKVTNSLLIKFAEFIIKASVNSTYLWGTCQKKLPKEAKKFKK